MSDIPSILTERGFVEADAFVYEDVSPDSLLEKLKGSIIDENKG